MHLLDLAVELHTQILCMHQASGRVHTGPGANVSSHATCVHSISVLKYRTRGTIVSSFFCGCFNVIQEVDDRQQKRAGDKTSDSEANRSEPPTVWCNLNVTSA